jgi:hypothetical protein
MTEYNANFAFVRHGYGCHNAAKPLYKSGVLKPNDVDVLRIADPELTPLGVDASTSNGCVISKVLRKLPVITGEPNMKMSPVHIVGCSPLIRSMETAYYMTKNWQNPPEKIYVFPLLREIDEESKDKYSKKSRERMESTPSYAMKSIQEQKKYLQSIGLRKYFDFTFVEKNSDLRMEPGDINNFIKWFATTAQVPAVKKTKNINCFIVTHAGVLRDFAHQGFSNNSGFIVNTTFLGSNVSYNKLIILDSYLPSYFFANYNNEEYTNSKYFCPSSRCGQLCNVIQQDKSDRKKLDGLGCAAYNEDDY